MILRPLLMFLSNVLVTVRGDRIESVAEHSSGKGDIALPSSWTLLPGLIDGHTHMLLQPEDALTPPVLRKAQADREVAAVAAARRTLEAGFTTVRNMDSEGANFADVALRDGSIAASCRVRGCSCQEIH